MTKDMEPTGVSSGGAHAQMDGLNWQLANEIAKRIAGRVLATPQQHRDKVWEVIKNELEEKFGEQSTGNLILLLTQNMVESQ